MPKKKVSNCLIIIICMLLVLLPVSVEATIYEDYEDEVILLAKCIKTELKLRGGELVKGISLTEADIKEWEKAEKVLRKEMDDEDHHYVFSKRFNSKDAALGYFVTLVGNKYRYLQILDSEISNAKPHYLYAKATKKNKYSLDYYINNKSVMYNKLDSLYKKEIEPYKKKNVQTRLAIIITCVANYFTYSKDDLTNNLAYTIKTKKGVCADYAYMTDYLLKKMGFPTKMVSIYRKFSKDDDWIWHKINAVKINGEWFYLDPTCMDSGEYAIYRDSRNRYFSAELDDLSFPGWIIRAVY